MKICYIAPQNTGVTYHRLQIPINKLSEHKEFDCYSINGFTKDNLPTQFDVIIFNRLFVQGEPYLEMAKDKGVKIILDLDDDIELPEWHIGYDTIGQPLVKERIIKHIEFADVVWCASEYLANKVKRWNKNSVYIPNAIDFRQPQFIIDKVKNEIPTVGYVGMANHHLDVQLLTNGFAKMLNEKNFNVMVAGYDKAQKDYWEMILAPFNTFGRLAESRLKVVEKTDFLNYGFVYNHIDIALAPLVNNEFNRCKSSLKILEAAAFKIPIIVSNVEPYKEFINIGLALTTHDNWDGQIQRLIKNKKVRETLGENLHEYVKENYNIQKINKLRIQTL